MKNNRFLNSLFLVLFFLGLVFRFFLTNYKGYERDIDVTRIWAKNVAENGIANFYKHDAYREYPPGYLYLLKLYQPFYKLFFKSDIPNTTNFDFILFHKLIVIGYDLMLAFLVGFVVFRLWKNRKLAYLASLAVFLNPALFYDSVYWGQIDILLALGILSSFFLLFLGSFFAGSFILMTICLIKLQALVLVPWFVICSLTKLKTGEIKKLVLGFIIALLLIFSPFLLAGEFTNVLTTIFNIKNVFPYFSLNALNFWWLVGGGEPWPLDSEVVFLGISAHTIGNIIFYASYLILLLVFLFQKNIKSKKDEFLLWIWGSGMILFNAFLFLTRMHERYLYYSVFVLSFLFFLKNNRNKFLKFVAILTSLTFLLNIAFVMNRVYYRDFLGKNFPFFLSLKFSYFLSLLHLFLGFLYFYIPFSIGLLKKPIIKIRKLPKVIKTNKILKLPYSLSKFTNFTKKKEAAYVKVKNAKKYLILILILAFILRFLNIWHPKEYIFDEVYHGFTAQEMAKGNKMAWEWWNSPPEGFAYEWTHPPLAKLVMAGSIVLMGQNNNVSQYAFRIPGIIFALGAIYLTYLLSVKLFRNEKIALLAALLISFDGLSFVMSRTGMADIYFLFFLLLTIYLSLKKNYFFSGIALGLSMATKWTGMYLYPVVGLVLLGKALVKKAKLFKNISNYFIYFIIIPILTYLFVYIPFFTSGHTWSQFIELQKQMWWYHTSLKATHGYQSPALSWPIMWRPVWFWVKYEANKIGNIYNLGNPFLWWSGLAVFPVFVFKAIEGIKNNKNFKYVFVVFSYFSFWLPWLFSPRIMFLHHYLPAIPFLCMMVAWFLNKILTIKNIKIQNIQFSGKSAVMAYLILIILCFCFFYPIYAGIKVPNNLVSIFFWLPSWR